MSLTSPRPDVRPRRRRTRWHEVHASDMAASEFLAGRISSRKITDIAERAATRIVDLATPLAVCLDPEGRVTVEAPDDAAEDDIVGVYNASVGMLSLYKNVRDDLSEVARERAAPSA